MYKYKSVLDEYTCVIRNVNTGEVVFNSKLNGVRPMVEFRLNHWNAHYETQSFMLIDRIIGLAAAKIAVYIGVVEIFTPIISKVALEYLESKGVKLEYGEVVANIMRKDGSDICPMEKAVTTTTSELEAFEMIKDWKRR